LIIAIAAIMFSFAVSLMPIFFHVAPLLPLLLLLIRHIAIIDGSLYLFSH